MKPETLEALKGSIEKWRKIINEGLEDRGIENCPLCQLFYKRSGSCRGCPVDDVSGDCCDSTPWEYWSEINAAGTWIADTPDKLAAARAELDFLRSLLPQEAAS